MDIEKLAQSTFNKHRDSVVLVDMRGATPEEGTRGTGFVIRSTNTGCLVMTCQHIIRDFVASRHTLCVSFAGNATEYEAKILHQRERTDISIIRVFGTKRKYPALHFGDAEDVPAGTNVCMLGYIFTGQTVRALNPGVCPGKTSAPPQIRGPGLKDVVFTSTGNAGLSGSPVMVGDKVIGVMFCSLIQVLHARSSETINGLLKHLLHVAPNANKSTEEMIDLLPVPV